MYNAYSGGPPPGLIHQSQQQQQQQQQPQAQQQQPQQQKPPQRGSFSPRGANPSRSAAIPIIRPDGSTTPNPQPTPTMRRPQGAPLASPSPSKTNPSGLSRAAAGAAVFVPKSSTGSAGKSEGPSSPTHEFRNMHMSGGAEAVMPGPNAQGFPPPNAAMGHYARAAVASGPPSFGPGNQSGRGTPTGYGGPMGYDSDSMASPFDPTYMGPLPGHGPNNPNAGEAPRPFNPYEHIDHSGPGGFDDPNSNSGSRPIRKPLQYHLSAPPLPHTSNLHPQHLAQHSYFMSPKLREDLFRRNEAINVSAPSITELGGAQIRPPQPDEVHVYKDLVPLEPDSSGPLPYGSRGNPVVIGGVPTQLLPRHLLPLNSAGLLGSVGSLSSLPISSSGGPLAPSAALAGYPTEVHRATCTLDGKTYVLRRIVGFNLGRERERALEGVERWRRLRCPGVVNVREAFTSWRWGEACECMRLLDRGVPRPTDLPIMPCRIHSQRSSLSMTSTRSRQLCSQSTCSRGLLASMLELGECSSMICTSPSGSCGATSARLALRFDKSTSTGWPRGALSRVRLS